MSQKNNYRAFPRQINDEDFIGDEGMSKRFYAACKAMQAMMQNNLHPSKKLIEDVVEASYMIADEMLKQENQ